jgi:hypothetical protein
MGIVESVAGKNIVSIGAAIMRRIPALHWFEYQRDRLRTRLREHQQPGWRLCPECRGTGNARYGTCLFCQESIRTTGVPSWYVRVKTVRQDWDILRWQARPGKPGNWHPSIPADVLRQFEEKQKREERTYRDLHKHERQ